jgi:hypothetical protein
LLVDHLFFLFHREKTQKKKKQNKACGLQVLHRSQEVSEEEDLKNLKKSEEED